jgi:hypothetical protein
MELLKVITDNGDWQRERHVQIRAPEYEKAVLTLLEKGMPLGMICVPVLDQTLVLIAL